MSAVARLLDATGHELDPSELASRPLELDDATAEHLRLAARRAGWVLERDGLACYGLGVAGRIELPEGLAAKRAATEASALLGAIPEHGALPLALGALPFWPDAPGALMLPQLCLLQSGGARRLVHLAPSAKPPSLRALTEAPPTPVGHAPERFSLEAVEGHEGFVERVRAALVAIEAGAFDKVVLAREVVVVADRPFAPELLLERLRRLHPSCLSFSLDAFVGASPELLCRRSGTAVYSQPLAGTVGRSGDLEQDRLLAESLLHSAKERAEHGFVVRAITEALEPFCSAVAAEVAPHLLELRNVVHLATAIRAELREPRVSCLELVAALHPTPAVGGTPREAALAYLSRTETLERERYAGPVGYLDAAGDGEFHLGIRSALLDGTRLRLLTGVGIVAGALPEAELVETQLKLQALLAAAVRP